MAYEPWQLDVLMQYALSDEQGNPIMSVFRGETEPSPKVDPEVLNRLFSADTTTDHKWAGLDAEGQSWVFYQAGGGEQAMTGSGRALEYLKVRYVKQYGDDEWAKVEEKFTNEVYNADEDVINRMRNCFGYFRHWPGNQGIYEHVVVALTTFLKQYRKLLEMNKSVPPEAQQPFEPTTIKTWEQMKQVNGKVANWVAAKRVRTDVRLAKHKQEDWIYNDDYVMAVAPLTYAAAVKYGWQGWDVANPEQFATVAQGELARNPWDSFLRNGGMIVFVHFHVTMPRWVSRQQQTGGGKPYEFYTLEDLLITLDKNSVKGNVDAWPVVDQESNQGMTVGTVKEMIEREAQRATEKKSNAIVNQPAVRRGHQSMVHPLYSEKSTYPMLPGAQAFNTAEEAQQLIAHFDMCIGEVKKWASKFKGKLASVVPSPDDE